MSLVQPQQQPQQQPVVVYPNTVTNNPPSHHSDGSFGTVFLVLAMIIVISAIACFLGRMCNKRLHKQKPKQAMNNFGPKEANVEFGNQSKSRPKEGHMEFGSHSKFRPKESHIEFGNHSKSRPKEGHVEFGNNRSFPPKERGDIEFGKHSFGPKDKDGDIQFGIFDKKIPSVKLNGNKENRGFKNGDENGQKKAVA